MGYEFSWATISAGDDSSKCKLEKYAVFRDEKQLSNRYNSPSESRKWTIISYNIQKHDAVFVYYTI